MAGTTLLATALIVGTGTTHVSAEELASGPVAAIEVPPGLTTENLSSGTPGSMSVSGCAEGGAVTVSYTMQYALTVGGPPTEVIPISLVPDVPVPEGGLVVLPLEPIASWLAESTPPPGYQIEIQARCEPNGVWATATITSGDSLGAPPVTAIPAPSPAEPPAVGTAEEADPSPSPGAAESLAETGPDQSGLTRSIAAGVLLLLVGSVFLLARNHCAHKA